MLPDNTDLKVADIVAMGLGKVYRLRQEHLQLLSQDLDDVGMQRLQVISQQLDELLLMFVSYISFCF